MKNKKPVIIIGNGGHASVLTEILLLSNRRIIGFTAPQQEINQYELLYLGQDEIIEEYDENEVELVLGLGSVNVSNVRKYLFEYFVDRGFRFAPIIHQSSLISNYAIIGDGVQILAGSIIQPFATISSNTIINTGSIIEHDCFIDCHVHIAPGSVLSGSVSIESGTHIGTGSTIIQGIRIGRDVLVAAGAVVVNDVFNGQKVAGVPAREMV